MSASPLCEPMLNHVSPEDLIPALLETAGEGDKDREFYTKYLHKVLTDPKARQEFQNRLLSHENPASLYKTIIRNVHSDKSQSDLATHTTQELKNIRNYIASRPTPTNRKHQTPYGRPKSGFDWTPSPGFSRNFDNTYNFDELFKRQRFTARSGQASPQASPANEEMSPGFDKEPQSVPEDLKHYEKKYGPLKFKQRNSGRANASLFSGKIVVNLQNARYDMKEGLVELAKSYFGFFQTPRLGIVFPSGPNSVQILSDYSDAPELFKALCMHFAKDKVLQTCNAFVRSPSLNAWYALNIPITT